MIPREFQPVQRPEFPLQVSLLKRHFGPVQAGNIYTQASPVSATLVMVRLTSSSSDPLGSEILPVILVRIFLRIKLQTIAAIRRRCDFDTRPKLRPTCQ